MKKLLSRRLKLVVPVLSISNCNILFASYQAFVGLISELLKWHAELPSVLDVGLVLFVVELGYYGMVSIWLKN